MTKEEAKLVKRFIRAADHLMNLEDQCGRAMQRGGLVGNTLATKYEKARDDYYAAKDALIGAAS